LHSKSSGRVCAIDALNPKSHPPTLKRFRMTDQPKSFFLSPEIHHYLVDHGAPPDEVQSWLIEETQRRFPNVSLMQVAPEQGALLTVLVRLIGAQRAVEVGTFTGYSALSIAYGLSPGGRLLCCDISDEWTSVARDAFDRAGVADRVDLRIAPAIETLKQLPADEPIDFAFIDADKQGYASYYEELVSRVRPNGLIVVDNVLWMGAVVDPKANDADTNAIRAFNDMVAADDRVDAAMLPVSDGITLLRKR
jgi:caffeoyl-CoA O-methyltransferase